MVAVVLSLACFSPENLCHGPPLVVSEVFILSVIAALTTGYAVACNVIDGVVHAVKVVVPIAVRLPIYTDSAIVTRPACEL